MKVKTFYKQSKIADKKRTYEQILKRRGKVLDMICKIPSRLTENGITHTGKPFITFYIP